ncbi:MAG: inosine-5'-monophosphate dehydrogenase [Candidatus Parcubacteria bacterium]|nr:MAG: inosine-5'-monophosphate dehydrogenase [Candidatus Parcubacteria bacterium]
MNEGLTFDDVLLIPKVSKINSRKDIDLSIKLHSKINLNLPIISSPMDTVTESEMSISMARNGGLGIIHRFCSIEEQVKQVKRVKRAENYLIENPICISPQATLKEIKNKSIEYDFETFLVVDENKKLLGLISKRDYFLEENENKKAFQLMTPFEKLIVSYKKISLAEAKNIFRKYKIEKIPIIDKNRKIVGLITFRDFKNSLNKKASRDKNGKLLVGAAIGIRGDYLERAKELVRAGVDILCIDVAHGHLEKSIKTIKEIKKYFPDIPLIAGNIATTEGAKDLIKAGADIIKVGIGPGSACTTRIIAGVGVPQLSAIIKAKSGSKNIPIIADGGCRNSGDIVKALAAGASAVMLGSLLAGTDESPGEIFYLKNKRVKAFRGMSSAEAYKNKLKSTNDNPEYEPISEGINYGFIEYKGSVKEVLTNLEKGIRSGFSYCGAINIKELWQRAEFIKISDKGYKESLPHTINFLD